MILRDFRFLLGSSAFFIFALSLLFSPSVVDAAKPDLPNRDTAYSARYAGQSVPDPVEIIAGSEIEVIFKFKNVGTATWNAGSYNYISAYTVEPKYRDSSFKGSNWQSSLQTASIGGSVAPGEIGELVLKLKASATQGNYREEFYLAAENHTWMQGGYFYIDVKVVEGKVTEVAKPQLEVEQSSTEEVKEEIVIGKTTYRASRFVGFPKSLTVRGGDRTQVTLAYQNIGSKDWDNYSIVAGDITKLATSPTQKNLFADESWVNEAVVMQNSKGVAAGSITREQIYMRAPAEAGKYSATFYLMVDDVVLEDTGFQLAVEVTSDAPSTYIPPSLTPASLGDKVIMQTDTPRLDAEPYIRVGLWRDANDVKFISYYDDYYVYVGGTKKGTIPKGQQALLKYRSGQYTLTSASVEVLSLEYIRLVPATDIHSVFTLINYDRVVSWKGNKNFNQYRGAMEFRRADNSANTLYVINELLFEDYVAGIGETSDAAPKEYIRALLTAARTYAYYIQEYTPKHSDRYFDVVAHTGDQLYLGYVSEVLQPNVVQAAKDTTGYMITYNDDIVITPYFAYTSGRTLDWSDVWGGAEKPWLVSVPADYDLRDGKTKYGHGVGMSARDAAYRADEEGINWEELILYYYSGVELELMY